MYANSAIAANSLFRSLLGAGFPLFATAMVCIFSSKVLSCGQTDANTLLVSQSWCKLGNDLAGLSDHCLVSRSDCLFRLWAKNKIME